MRVWIDLANSPHVLLFRPIIAELEKRGHEVGLTARDFAQTVALAEDLGLACDVIGTHEPRGRLRKAANIARRALALRAWARKWRPDVAAGHNSYAQIVAGRLSRVPVLTMMDYEGQPANSLAFRLARTIILPASFPADARRRQGARESKTRLYDGLKEQIYLWDFEPDREFRQHEGLRRDAVLVVVRPAATMALYHDFENPLFGPLVEMLSGKPDVQALLLPRTPEQRAALAGEVPESFVIPERPLDGPNLLAAADLVIGAGGTMNREAAVLGTPVYSIYAGAPAAVDLWLARQGLMNIVRDRADLEAIAFEHKKPGVLPPVDQGRELMKQIVEWILETATPP